MCLLQRLLLITVGRYSSLEVLRLLGMRYVSVGVHKENDDALLTRFINGRMRKLRPIHSLDLRDRADRAAVNRSPAHFLKRGG
jgi:hypothetical protein